MTSRLLAQQDTERAARNEANLRAYDRKVGIPAFFREPWPQPLTPIEIEHFTKRQTA